MVFRNSPHVKRLVCKGCFGSLIPGVSCLVYRSTQDRESTGTLGITEVKDVGVDAVDSVKEGKKKKDRSERLIIHECKVCRARRKYPVKGYNKLFHDTTPSTIKEIE
jgi:RNase P subunit RPR2